VEPFVQARQLGGLDLVDKVIGDTDWGERWMQRQAVLVAIVAAVATATYWGRSRPDGPAPGEAAARLVLWAALLGALVYVLLVSLVSHANAVEGSFWATTADFIHLTSAAVWIGMVVQMGLTLVWARREVPDGVRTNFLAAHLQRFSVLAAVSVIALLATGTFSALTEIPEWGSLIDTSYGRALLIKLALVGLLLPVAGLNAIVLRPRALRHLPAGRREGLERLRGVLLRSIWLEAALAAGVLLIVGVLTQYPTSRVVVDSENYVQESTEAVVGFESSSQAGDVGVNLSISPNSVGANSYQVFLFPTPGQPLTEVLQVRLRFKPPDPALGPSEVIADEVNPNFFKASGSFFTTSGGWEVQVFVRRAQVDDVSTFFRVPVTGSAAGPGGERDRFALPLVAGTWSLVAAVALAVAAAMFWMPAQQWPRIHVRVARWFRMSAITCGVIGLALLLGVHQHTGLTSEQARTGNPVAATDASVARGRQLYEQNCTQCHGLTGRGDGPLAGTLALPPADFKLHIPYHTDLFFFEVITRGFGDVMPPFGDQLSEEDRWNLINFLRAEHSLEKQLE
jgi:copper transport protein